MKKLLSFLLVVAMVLSLTGCGEKKNYEAAVEAYNNGDYETALESFTELGDYEDSQDYIEKCHLAIAYSYLASQDYANLAAEILKLNDASKATLLTDVNSVLEDVLSNYHYGSGDLHSLLELQMVLTELGVSYTSASFALLEKVINFDDVFQSWEELYDVLSDYSSSVIDLINSMVTDSTSDILNNDVPQLNAIADAIEQNNSTSDEYVSKYIEIIRSITTNMAGELNNLNDSATAENYYNNYIAAIEAYNEFITTFNEEFLSERNEIASEFDSAFGK